MTNASNRLGGETSPYLLQHADNPVHWYPWGADAFGAARDRDVPILLSVGYSACHWCHVMAHESFENDAVAQLMNERFVNVKVDREERPDIDRIYQVAHQLLTQRPGGWPLTMFLNPHDQQPFFGGTYFPLESRYGMPAFPDLLERVAGYYAEHRDDIEAQAVQLAYVFARLEPRSSVDAAQIDAAPIAAARAAWNDQFDRDFGGFTGAPKFPHAAVLERLLRHWRGTAHAPEPDLDALYLVSLTLKRMADGGIHDHLAGGFCRYSVDAHWQIPHFEKMLYDNGPLLAVFAQAALATGEPAFRRVAGGIADWLAAEMTAPNGAFHSSLDADSEGEEGRCYVWTPEAVREALSADEYPAFAAYYGLDEEPNFEGRWHLTVRRDSAELADEFGIDGQALDARLGAARRKLLDIRRQRVPPGRDEKQLASWNALAIRGLAIAARCLERPELTAAAQRAADSLRESLVVDGRLRATFKDGRARFAAYLDDHAFLVDALLELLQNDWRGEDLDFAVALADDLLAHFEDREHGGFWFTADDHETLMHRSKPLADEALPSGAGVAALALQRLGFLLGESRYLDAAERALQNAWEALGRLPHAHATLLSAVEEYLGHPEIVIIRGAGPDLEEWRRVATRVWTPARLVLGIDAAETRLPGALGERAADPDGTIAYRCEGQRCSLPIRSLDELARELSAS